MKISTKVMRRIVFSLVMLFLLTPLTVFAQDGFYVIPVAMNKPLRNVITVAKANGKFTDPVAAVNSITDASATNPYLVVIGPGVYTVTSPVVMKPYVDIAGSGENVTKITGALGIPYSPLYNSGLIYGANNSALSSLSVANTGGNSASIALFNLHTSPTVTNVTATASGGTQNYGVYNIQSSPTMNGVTAKASGGTDNYGVLNNQSSPTMTDVTAMASGGTGTNIGVENFDSSPSTMTNVTATASGGTNNYGVYNINSSSLTMTNVTATALGGETKNYGIYNYSSSPTMTNVTAKGSGTRWTSCYGIYNDYISSNPVIRRTTMSGGTGGLYTETGCTAMVSQSTIIGGVGGTGTKTCVACDNGSGKALKTTDCSVLP
jgi:hypothetical protein